MSTKLSMQQVKYLNLSNISNIVSINPLGDSFLHPLPWPQLAGISCPMVYVSISSPE